MAILNYDNKKGYELLMRKARRICSLVLAILLATGVFLYSVPYENTSARENNLGKPRFKLETVNEGTGVKITIYKTKEADFYSIYMVQFENEYTKYYYKKSKDAHYYNYNRFLTYVNEDGKKTRTYIINGLPQGTYTFKIYAENDDFERGSKKQSITVKAAETKSRKEKKYDFSDTKVGDIIKFGAYEQDDNMLNGQEDIEWIVIAKDKKQMFVMSRYVIDMIPYLDSSTYEDIYYNYEKDTYEFLGKSLNSLWEISGVREWLNNEFYKKAFTKNERKLIKKTSLIDTCNTDGYEYSHYDNISDKNVKIFLLSVNDIENSDYGLNIMWDRDHNFYKPYLMCETTAYVKAQWNIYCDQKNEKGEEIACCPWYLRSSECKDAYCVNKEGNYDSICYGHGIRPVMYIKL